MNPQGVNEAIDSANKLSDLGMITVLLLLLGVLIWFIYRENESRKEDDKLIGQLSSSLDRIATAMEHQNTMFEFLKDQLELAQENNSRLKDNIENGISKIGGDVADIKMAVLSGKVTIS